MNKELSLFCLRKRLFPPMSYILTSFHQTRTCVCCRDQFCMCIVFNFTCLRRPFLSRHAWNTTLKAFRASIGKESVMRPLETFTRLWNQAPRFVQVTIASLLCNLKVILKGARTQWYFELFWAATKLPLSWGKPENNSLLRQKNNKEIIINHKGTKMVRDGED